jgi:Zn-dependent protease
VIIGWGRPVPINWDNLSRPRLQDTLIAMAGPAMNLLLAALLMGLVKLANLTSMFGVIDILKQLIFISLLLCFFNLIPIPPLDGSHVLLHLTRMPFEVYFRIAQVGLILVIVALQTKPVRIYLGWALDTSYRLFARAWGLPIDF